MKETRKEISKAISKLYADEVKSIFKIISMVLDHNPDFKAAASACLDRFQKTALDDAIPIIEDYMLIKVPFGYDSVLAGEDLEIYCELIRLMDAQKLKKAERVEILSKVLSSDALLEGLCVMGMIGDDEMEKIFKSIGCPGRYEELKSDPVYIKRHDYLERIKGYADAAVNLYGVLDTADFALIVGYYEPEVQVSARDVYADYEEDPKDWRNIFENSAANRKSGKRLYSLEKKKDKYSGYKRPGGPYSETFFFTSEFFCVFTVEKLLRGCCDRALVTVSGYLISEYFEADYKHELDMFMEYVFKVQQVGPDEWDEFDKISRGDLSYRDLLDIADEKDIFLPESCLQSRLVARKLQKCYLKADPKLKKWALRWILT